MTLSAQFAPLGNTSVSHEHFSWGKRWGTEYVSACLWKGAHGAGAPRIVDFMRVLVSSRGCLFKRRQEFKSPLAHEWKMASDLGF